jgi:hypothetical protein
MLRLASFFAIACLSLAATALLTAPKSLAKEQPRSDHQTDQGERNRLETSSPEHAVSFHARFSLN